CKSLYSRGWVKLSPSLNFLNTLAEEIIHDKTTPLTRDRSKKKKLATTASHENMPTAPSIPYRHSCFRYHNPTSNDAPLPLEPSPPLLQPAAAPSWAYA
ncbi:unnamed protein product, partial [Ectocarpus sp. 13 AM-2016]